MRHLVRVIAPGAQVTDLGGTMSLNLRLEPGATVLRVHQGFVSRARVLALQGVRRRLAAAGLLVAAPLSVDGRAVFRCADRWAELERHIPHTPAAFTPASYDALFEATGGLHAALAALRVPVPRPAVATYGPPGSLRRWLAFTAATIGDGVEAAGAVREAQGLVARLRAAWVPARLLPNQLVHGDLRPGNLCWTASGRPIHLDFGFLALRPRVHDLAYALAFMVARLQGEADPADFPWDRVPSLLLAYERRAPALKAEEPRALAPYTAAVALYHTALAGFSTDPPAQLRERRPFLRLARLLLARPPF